MAQARKFEVSWFRECKDMKIVGPYTFSQAVDLAQQLYKDPGVDHIRILEVTE